MVLIKLLMMVLYAPGLVELIVVELVVELENAIKLLEMSDVETVSAGTYKSVVGYIK